MMRNQQTDAIRAIILVYRSQNISAENSNEENSTSRDHGSSTMDADEKVAPKIPLIAVDIINKLVNWEINEIEKLNAVK